MNSRKRTRTDLAKWPLMQTAIFMLLFSVEMDLQDRALRYDSARRLKKD